ncbi:ATP-binding cassette domain-containing protein [Priestia megaterium]
MYALKISNMTKYINEKPLYENVNFSLKSGEICYLSGDNGVGKSVFIDCILGFSDLDKGTVSINDINIKDRKFVRRNTGIVSIDHQDPLLPFTPQEYFTIIIGIYNIKNINHKLNTLIDRLGVGEFLNTSFQKLSFGSKKKVQLISSLLYDPTFLVCDEIFEGLDESSVQVVKEIFKERFLENKTTLFTTHLFNEATDISTVNIKVEDKKILYNSRYDHHEL